MCFFAVTSGFGWNPLSLSGCSKARARVPSSLAVKPS